MDSDSELETPLPEQRESPAVIDEKADKLAEEIRRSQHFIVFTGAGISTSAGIPDYRGPEGMWTLKAQGRERTGKTVNTPQAIPTPTHMALVELQNRGILKHVVSQNTDGLHRRSGIDLNKISELHGNSNREECGKCGKEYLRDFRVVGTVLSEDDDHVTGRQCGICGGDLFDTIIRFGESLPREAFNVADTQSYHADLCLVLGSSLTVRPAAMIPQFASRHGGRLAICNLQETTLDESASIRVFAETDDFMRRVMAKLDIPIPPFVLTRHLAVRILEMGAGQLQVQVQGTDLDHTPMSYLKTVRLLRDGQKATEEPFEFTIQGGLQQGEEVRVELEFMGHYNEPNLEVAFSYPETAEDTKYFRLRYDPQTGKWESSSLRQLE